MSLRPYLGVNVSPANVEEMSFRGLLEEGETLLALFDGMLFDENGRRVGGLALNDFVALTDTRLITWARGFFNDTVDGFPWKDVDVVEAAKWDPFHGRVRLAFRLPPLLPGSRRIQVRGQGDADASSVERIFVNTLDYVPADDVYVLAKMVAWVGDRVVAGVRAGELFALFSEEFPPRDRPPTIPQLLYQMPEAEVVSPPVPPEPPKRRWWQFGKRNQNEEVGPAAIVAAYERERSGMSRPESPRGTAPLAPQSSAPPSVFGDKPVVYDVSRALRLMLETPRRLSGGVRRAGQIMSGANELMSGMQDPMVRRTALNGLRRAVDRQEADQGPLASVAPIMRAVLRFAEPETSTPSGSSSSSRRIQVRAAVRQQVRVAGAGEPDEARPAPEPKEMPSRPSVQASATVRRQVNLRRVDSAEGPAAAPAAEAAKPAGPVVQASPAKSAGPVIQTSATVRRQVTLRRVEPEVGPPAEDSAHEPSPTAPVIQTSASVRRQGSLRRVELASAEANGASNGNGNGNSQDLLPPGETLREDASAQADRIPVRRIVVNRSAGDEE